MEEERGEGVRGEGVRGEGVRGEGVRGEVGVRITPEDVSSVNRGVGRIGPSGYPIGGGIVPGTKLDAIRQLQEQKVLSVLAREKEARRVLTDAWFKQLPAGIDPATLTILKIVAEEYVNGRREAVRMAAARTFGDYLALWTSKQQIDITSVIKDGEILKRVNRARAELAKSKNGESDIGASE